MSLAGLSNLVWYRAVLTRIVDIWPTDGSKCEAGLPCTLVSYSKIRYCSNCGRRTKMLTRSILRQYSKSDKKKCYVCLRKLG